MRNAKYVLPLPPMHQHLPSPIPGEFEAGVGCRVGSQPTAGRCERLLRHFTKSVIYAILLRF
jgi:hypothetical protein